MLNIYSYGFTTVCPNDGQYIYYSFDLQVNKIVMVEDIIKKCKTFKSEYQESIANELHKEFGGIQRLTATHQNVKIETLRRYYE